MSQIEKWQSDASDEFEMLEVFNMLFICGLTEHLERSRQSRVNKSTS